MALTRFGIVLMAASMLVAQTSVARADDLETAGKPALVVPTVYVPPPYARPASAQPAMMLTVGGALADLFTTLAVINDGSGRELNPILGQNPGRIIAFKSALLVPQLLAERHLARHGHPKAAMWLGVALGGVGAALAMHNMSIGR
jgi:hypothetical protein